MIGQVVYFRIARAAVMRRMDWTDIGPAEAAKVIGVAKENVAAIIAARKAGKP
jgi:plasmid maintenance system antidote protein VapI